MNRIEIIHKIASFTNSSESYSANYYSTFGKSEVFIRDTRYYSSGAVKFRFIYSFTREELYVFAPLTPHSSYDDTYFDICDSIFDRLHLEKYQYRLIGIDEVVCLIHYLDWSSIKNDTVHKKTLEIFLQEMAKCVNKMREFIDEYGYESF